MRYLMVATPITLMFLIAPSALIVLGFDYVVPGGNPLQKVHPATYLMVLCLIVFFLTGRANGLRDLMFSRPAVWYFFAGLFLMVLYSTLMLSTPSVFLIDTYFSAGLVFLLIGVMDIAERRRLARTFDVLLALNSMLGIVESVKDWRLVPLTQWSAVLGQYIYPYEFRSTAFLGHPLTNSYVTATYMLSLIITKRISNAFVKYPLLLLHFIALFAFGSRGGTVFLLIALAIYIIYNIVGAVRTGRMSKDVLIYLCIGIPCTLLVALIVLDSGFADRFLNRFSNDKGSAESRSIVLDMLADFPIGSLIIGPPADLVFALLKRYNIIAVENFWLAFCFSFGIVGCAIFWPALLQFYRCIRHQSSLASYGLLTFFMALCTTSLSIASKNYALFFVTIICMTSLDFDAVKKTAVGRPVRQPLEPLGGRLAFPAPGLASASLRSAADPAGST